MKRRVKTLTKKCENLNGRMISDIHLFDTNYIKFDNDDFFMKTALNHLNQKFESLQNELLIRNCHQFQNIIFENLVFQMSIFVNFRKKMHTFKKKLTI